MNKRACHVLSCQPNESLDVITTIGQAFELRYNEFIQSQQTAAEQNEPLKTSEFDEKFQSTENEQENQFVPSANTNQLEQTSNVTNSINSQDVYKENWFHGKMNREEAEHLLAHSGDFLVRESAKCPGQFILSGRYNDQFKHLLLVDPEGVIRTKDYEFDSIQHLITYHKSGNIPIVSADSELFLQTPVLHIQ